MEDEDDFATALQVLGAFLDRAPLTETISQIEGSLEGSDQDEVHRVLSSFIAKDMEKRATLAAANPSYPPEIAAAYGGIAATYRAAASASVKRPSYEDIPGWNGLNRWERNFCKKPRNWNFCWKVDGDRNEAYKQRHRNFEGARTSAMADGTRANAFQHTLWVALMSKSGGMARALEFGELHERSITWNKYSTPGDRMQSYMDLWNNDKGAIIYHENGGRNETVQCTHSFYAAKEALHIGATYAYNIYPNSSRMKFIRWKNSEGVVVRIRREKANCVG